MYTVILGASGGIGQAVVNRLADRPLLMAGRNLNRMETMLAALAPSEPPHLATRLDLADDESTGAGTAALIDALGGNAVSALVHAVGHVELRPVADTDADTWRRTLAVNLVGPARATAALLPKLRAARGTVVFINSTAGLTANPNWSAYAASKFGLRALAESLRAEEAEAGIRVATIYPGRTATDMQRQVRAAEGGPYEPERYVDPSAVADAVALVLDTPAGQTIEELKIRPAAR